MKRKIEDIRIYKTTEWLIFCVGLFMDLLLAGAGWYFFESETEMVKALSLVFAIHTFGGDPLVDHVMVVGEGMPYLAALLVLHRSLWEVTVQGTLCVGLDSTVEALHSKGKAL